MAPSRHSRNYLRVRGEYRLIAHSASCHGELPPRARRILSVMQWRGKICGTTSACAENTHTKNLYLNTKRNYLRVRGEYY